MLNVEKNKTWCYIRRWGRRPWLLFVTLKNKYILIEWFFIHLRIHTTGHKFISETWLRSRFRNNIDPLLTIWRPVWQQATRGQCTDMAVSQQHGCLEGGTATLLTRVGVSLLCLGRTGSEGELALHGRLCFPFLPQQFTPVQLWSFGERRQLVFALSKGEEEIKHTQRIKIGSNEAEVWPQLSAECVWICKQRSNGLK